MGQSDRRAGVFYQRLSRWKPEMLALREILLGTPLNETFKWRQPCYTWQEQNVAMPAGYASRCVLSFFRGVQLDDPRGLLVPPGENSRSARVMQFQSVVEIVEARGAIEGFVAASIEHVRVGEKVDLCTDDIAYPEELRSELTADDAFGAAWEALTPGRQRGWLLHFSQAKQAATRVRRIAKAKDAILSGKGMHDR